MNLKNNLLIDTINKKECDRHPVWLMRQAGRILPQYRALRGKLSGFIELVKTPHLAAEVTIQPVDELDVDAAIIFSDILVIPEAMGLEYELIEKKGPFFPKTIASKSDIDRLSSGMEAAERLDYVYNALQITKKNLDNRVPLIGFSGAPWTLLAYMVEGSGSKTFSKAKKFLYQEPVLAHQLLEKITETIIEYLKLKIQNGASVVQIFDSWAGALTLDQYQTFALPYLKTIADAIDEVPMVVFAKGAWFAMEEINTLNCEVVGLDWNTKPALARKIFPDKVLQGNLDPCLLYSDPQNIRDSVHKMLSEFGPWHIANLGHGVYPDTPLENVKVFVEAVKSYKK